MIAVDTNVVADYVRGRLKALPNGELYLPYIVQAELEAGMAAGGVATRAHDAIRALMSADMMVRSPGLGKEIISCYAQIFAYLRSQGTPVSPNDIWIAAECMQLGLPLMTSDTDFQRIPQVSLYNSF